MKLGFSNLIRIYIGELGFEVYQCPLSLDNMPTDDSGDFVGTFSEQNAFIESAPPYELIDPNSPTRTNREEDSSSWGELSDCLSSLAQCICAILLVFGAAIIFSIYQSKFHSSVILEHNKTVTCHTPTFYHPKNKTFSEGFVLLCDFLKIRYAKEIVEWVRE